MHCSSIAKSKWLANRGYAVMQANFRGSAGFGKDFGKQAESDQVVHAPQAKDIPVAHALFPGEGHGFARPENSKAFFAVAEGILGQRPGTRAGGWWRRSGMAWPGPA
ncbi:prolyl oligopeptidase family protein [Lysobacter ruishenii]|uniref:Prolyl oligopeptidase family protein n=1 Tax=Aerolutibacter ruishenii TaxID=686800 RepID=A0A562LWQ5_9GAMM|nr:prolyl oligopeptidase family protein [Lysobacter ruishenii]